MSANVLIRRTPVRNIAFTYGANGTFATRGNGVLGHAGHSATSAVNAITAMVAQMLIVLNGRVLCTHILFAHKLSIIQLWCMSL